MNEFVSPEQALYRHIDRLNTYLHQYVCLNMDLEKCERVTKLLLDTVALRHQIMMAWEAA